LTKKSWVVDGRYTGKKKKKEKVDPKPFSGTMIPTPKAGWPTKGGAEEGKGIGHLE